MISQTYKLKFPIKLGDEDVVELEIVKPTPKVLKKYDIVNLTMADQIKLASDCANVPPSVIETLDLDDYMSIVGIITDWLVEASKREFDVPKGNVYHYELLHQATADGKSLTELTVTKPTPKILKKYDVQNMKTADQIRLAADCTGVQPSTIESLDFDDYMGVISIPRPIHE